MRLRPFILCFYRTAFTVQKSGLKSSAFHPKSFPRISPKSYRHKFCLKSFFIPFFNLSHKRPAFAFTPKAGTHSAFGERSHTTAHTAKHGAFRMGGGITTLGAFRTFANLPGPGVSTANFAAFGSWPGVLQKNAESLRDSDALMRVAVPQASRPRWAALLCLQFGDVAVFSLCAQGFPHMQKRVWYHYPRRAPRVVETLGGRLSKGLICHFSRSGGLH